MKSETMVRKLALVVFSLSVVVVLIYMVAGEDWQVKAAAVQAAGTGAFRTKGKYGIDIPKKYERVEDAIVAVMPFSLGSHRGTMFHLANGSSQYSRIKYSESVELLRRESCRCFLDTGKGVANTLYIPDPCDQYTTQRARCQKQQRPEIVLSTEKGPLKLGITCTRIDALIANCPVR